MMLAFLTNNVSFSSYFSVIFKYFAFLTHIRKKCATRKVSTKNTIIWDTNTRNMWILADETCRFTNVSNITS